MRVRLAVKGASEAELLASFEKLHAAIDAIDGVQVVGADRDGYGEPGAAFVVVYYAPNTGKP